MALRHGGCRTTLLSSRQFALWISVVCEYVVLIELVGPWHWRLLSLQCMNIRGFFLAQVARGGVPRDQSCGGGRHSLLISLGPGVCRDWTERVAYCDAAIADADSWEESVCVPIQKYSVGKKYDIELKPLFSAFRPRAIGATSIRAVLVNYLPLLEAYLQPEDDEFEEDLDRPARPPMDPVVPLKRSVTHILREVRHSIPSAVATQSLLELWLLKLMLECFYRACSAHVMRLHPWSDSRGSHRLLICIGFVQFRFRSSPHGGYWKGLLYIMYPIAWHGSCLKVIFSR